MRPKKNRLPLKFYEIIIDRLIDSLNEPSLRDAYSKQGFEILGTTPEETASIMRQDYERWGPILSQLKLKLD